jgi:hypothetical protein
VLGDILELDCYILSSKRVGTKFFIQLCSKTSVSLLRAPPLGLRTECERSILRKKSF